MLVPPDGFGIVEQGIYRSNALQPDNFEYIRSLKIKTAIVLSPEAPTRAVLTFLEENNTKLIHLGLKAWRPGVDWRPMSDELVKQALQLILNSQTHPLLLLCTSGIHHTGTLIGCLRKMQRWNFNSIVEEVFILFHFKEEEEEEKN